MHRLDLTEDFSPIERQAYHGWLGFRAESADLSLRLGALADYGDAGGRSGTEARAVLLYMQEQRPQAADAFDEAYAEAPSFRLRNHALAARR